MNRFQISTRGFIPNFCEERVPEEFQYLETFYQYYKNNTSENYRKFIDNSKKAIPEIDISQYSLSQVQKIYSVTSIICHCYAWCDKPFKTVIPHIIGKPWKESADYLGIPPVLTHSAVDLFNWRLKDITKPFHLDNLEVINLMTKDPQVQKSEEWFYLPMIAIEGECGPMLHYMENIYSNIDRGKLDPELFIPNLLKIKALLKRQIEIIKIIRSHCRPEHFYHKIRPFLGGSKNNNGGWMLENLGNISYEGGSAAQSSLIQIEDIFFGIKHPHDTFLMEMRDYMPLAHKEYLEHTTSRMNLKKYLQDKPESFKNPILYEYNECLKLIYKFRDTHMGIVHTYIKKFNNSIGTGGTNIDENLKTYLNNTKKQIDYSGKNTNIKKTLELCNYNIFSAIILCVAICSYLLLYR